MEQLMTANVRSRVTEREMVNSNVKGKDSATAMSHAVAHDNGNMTRILLGNGAYPFAECR